MRPHTYRTVLLLAAAMLIPALGSAQAPSLQDVQVADIETMKEKFVGLAQAFLERGTLLFEEGQIDGAIAALERALSADPQLAPGHYRVGLCYMNRNRNEDAQKHLKIFLELAPNDPEADSAHRLLEVLRRSE